MIFLLYVYTHSHTMELFFSLKIKANSAICHDMGEPGGYYA